MSINDYKKVININPNESENINYNSLDINNINISEIIKLAQGAESIIYKITFSTNIIDPLVLKYRIPKSYRHEDLDLSLRIKRTKSEKKLYKKLKENGIPTCVVPKIPQILIQKIFNSLNLNISNNLSREKKEKYENFEKTSIFMKFYENSEINLQKDIKSNFLVKFAEIIKKLHEISVIHGDLTISNFLFLEKNDEVLLIDLGLSFVSEKVEDKAVDLFVFERGLQSFGLSDADLQLFYKNYSKNDNNSEKYVLKKLEEIRSRGRKK